jgi:hypothetical protein
VLLLGACGGSSGAASSTTTNPTTTTNGTGAGARNGAFTACLKQHGITLPSGGFRRPGAGLGTPGSRPARSPAQQQAFAACRSKLPTGGGFGRGANPQAFQAYLSCLGDHGVTVPTTTAGSTPRGAGSGLAGVRSDPKFATANKTCAPLLPTFGSTTTTTPN